jgi:hypothetical protein
MRCKPEYPYRQLIHSPNGRVVKDSQLLLHPSNRILQIRTCSCIHAQAVLVVPCPLLTPTTMHLASRPVSPPQV